MTVVVNKTADDLMLGLGNMYDAMVADYAKFMVPDTDHKKTMNDDYKNGIAYKFGKKYVKVLGNNGVIAFVVNTDNDKKFKKGDILKPAGYNAPARNAARGNIFDGNYPINWTGPLYL